MNTHTAPSPLEGLNASSVELDACSCVLRMLVQRLEADQPCDAQDLMATLNDEHERLAAAHLTGPTTEACFSRCMDILHQWESAVRH